MTEHGAIHDQPPAEEHPHLPEPTIWPITVAFGITMISLGVLTSIVFIIFGIVVVIIGIYGWAGDLRHE